MGNKSYPSESDVKTDLTGICFEGGFEEDWRRFSSGGIGCDMEGPGRVIAGFQGS